MANIAEKWMVSGDSYPHSIMACEHHEAECWLRGTHEVGINQPQLFKAWDRSVSMASNPPWTWHWCTSPNFPLDHPLTSGPSRWEPVNLFPWIIQTIAIHYIYQPLSHHQSSKSSSRPTYPSQLSSSCNVPPHGILVHSPTSPVVCWYSS